MRRHLALVIDLSCVTVSAFLALLIRDNLVVYEPHWDATVPYAAITVASAALVFAAFRPHKAIWQYTSLPDVLRIIAAVTVALLLALFVSFALSRLQGVARSIPIIQWLLLISILLGTRVTARVWHERRHRNDRIGEDSRLQHVLIIGASRLTELYLESLERYGAKNFKVVGILSESGELRGQLLRRLVILGTPEELLRVLADLEIHGVTVERIVVMQTINELSRQASEVLLTLERDSGIKVDWLTERLGFSDGTNSAETGCSAPNSDAAIVNLAEKPDSLSLGRYGYAKRAIDIAAAGFLSLVLLPLALLVGLAVAADIGFPVIFWQQRPGRAGRPFKLYKFCTMRRLHDKDGRRIADELRSTRVGCLLRRTRLDELPQLYNILVGEMSFVGPRPLLPCDQPDDTALRLSLRPGLTGMAQVHGKATMSPNDKNALDVWYIHNASLWLDFKILLRTLLVFVRGERVDHTMLRMALDQVERLKTQGELVSIVPSSLRRRTELAQSVG